MATPVLGSTPGPDALPQKKVLEDKLPFAYERTTASATHYLARICLGTGFTLTTW